MALTCAIVSRKVLPFVANGQASRYNLSIKGTVFAALLSARSPSTANLGRISENPRHCQQTPTTTTNPPITSGLSDCYNAAPSPHELPVPESQQMDGYQSDFIQEQHHDCFNPDLLGPPHANPNSNGDKDSSDLNSFATKSVHDLPSLTYLCNDEKVALPHGNPLSSQQHPAPKSTFTNSVTQLLYQPLPDNLPCWQWRLLSHCKCYEPLPFRSD